MEAVSWELEAELRAHKLQETSTTQSPPAARGWVVGQCCQHQPHYYLISGLPVYLMSQEEIKSSCMCVELYMYPRGLPLETSTDLSVRISFTEFDGVHTAYEGLFLFEQAPARLWSINNKMVEYCGIHSGTLARCGFIYTMCLSLEVNNILYTVGCLLCAFSLQQYSFREDHTVEQELSQLSSNKSW